jgi:hypothetical protein
LIDLDQFRAADRSIYRKAAIGRAGVARSQLYEARPPSQPSRAAALLLAR